MKWYSIKLRKKEEKDGHYRACVRGCALSVSRKAKSFVVRRTGQELLAGERATPKGKTRKPGTAHTTSCEASAESTEIADSNDVAQDKATQKIFRARELMEYTVAALNVDSVLACEDGYYERMFGVSKYLSSGQDMKLAPVEATNAKCKPKRKAALKYEENQKYEMEEVGLAP